MLQVNCMSSHGTYQQNTGIHIGIIKKCVIMKIVSIERCLPTQGQLNLILKYVSHQTSKWATQPYPSILPLSMPSLWSSLHGPPHYFPSLPLSFSNTLPIHTPFLFLLLSSTTPQKPLYSLPILPIPSPPLSCHFHATYQINQLTIILLETVWFKYGTQTDKQRDRHLYSIIRFQYLPTIGTDFDSLHAKQHP